MLLVKESVIDLLFVVVGHLQDSLFPLALLHEVRARDGQQTGDHLVAELLAMLELEQHGEVVLNVS